MTSQSNIAVLADRELADYGFARARDIAFDAVQALWRRRQSEGWQQKQIADAIGRDPGWVSRNLSAPGNWTLRTIGELVGGLKGEIEISVNAIEDPLPQRSNFDAYLGYSPPKSIPASNNISANKIEFLERRRGTPFDMHIEIKK